MAEYETMLHTCSDDSNGGVMLKVYGLDYFWFSLSVLYTNNCESHTDRVIKSTLIHY